jgi:hypothetical protein
MHAVTASSPISKVHVPLRDQVIDHFPEGFIASWLSEN